MLVPIEPIYEPHDDPVAAESNVTTLTIRDSIPLTARCHYCGIPNAVSATPLTRDHVVPKSRDGRNTWWNLVPACQTCNLAKANDDWCTCPFCTRATQLWAFGLRRSTLKGGLKFKTSSKPTGEISDPRWEALRTLSVQM